MSEKLAEPKRGDGKSLVTAAAELQALLGGRASVAIEDRERHSRGKGIPDSGLPDIVAWPESNEEVAAVVRVCVSHRLPIVAYGVGSSLAGQVAAVAGGVCLNMSRMDRVLSVSHLSMDCRVQAGVRRVALNQHLRGSGLFFPLDPGADATIGGMAATRASGTNAVGYGTIRNVVLGLTVVTPNGQIIHTGSRARKSASGYDLTALYLGSEGTLGIITELQLKLSGRPSALVTAVCQFPDLRSAVETASKALQSGITVSRMELLDELQTDACIRYSKLEAMQPTPTIFAEFHGTPMAVREQAGLFHRLALERGCFSWQEAETEEDRNRLWQARHSAYWADLKLAPGKSDIETDACVPIEHLVDCILETQADVRDSGLLAPLVGHVGDGNFHLIILFDSADEEETARAEALAERVSRRAIRFGGTCSGEHGVGLHKTPYLVHEHGEALEVMRAIKAALDPMGLMNPGKLIPEGAND